MLVAPRGVGGREVPAVGVSTPVRGKLAFGEVLERVAVLPGGGSPPAVSWCSAFGMLMLLLTTSTPRTPTSPVGCAPYRSRLAVDGDGQQRLQHAEHGQRVARRPKTWLRMAMVPTPSVRTKAATPRSGP